MSPTPPRVCLTCLASYAPPVVADGSRLGASGGVCPFCGSVGWSTREAVAADPDYLYQVVQRSLAAAARARIVYGLPANLADPEMYGVERVTPRERIERIVGSVRAFVGHSVRT